MELTRPCRAVLTAAVAIVACSAHAGRPLDTDDAAVIARGACQVETFGRAVRGTDGTHTRDFGFAPSCNLFGASELLLGVDRGGVGQPDAASRMTIQFKSVPRAVDAGPFGHGLVATYGEDVVRHAGRGAARAGSLSLIASARPFTAWQFDFNLGALHVASPGDRGRRNHLTWGADGQWSLTPTITLVAERTGASALGRAWQVGLTLAATRQATFDFALGKRRETGSRASFATLGLTWVTLAEP